MLLMGDVMLGRMVNRRLASELPGYAWGDTLPLLAAADARLCNLECVLADHGHPWTATPKTFHFRSDARNIAVLQTAAIDCVSVANNHTLDYGREALLEMLGLLDAAGIAHAGAGRDAAECARPAIVVSAQQRIGVVAFTDDLPEWEATAQQAGTCYVPIDLDDPRAARLLERVRASKAGVDLLIVSAHWGPNWGYRPPNEHPPFTRALIDAGADVVFGHSGHVCRGIEWYRGKPILYCTGNFIDDYAVDEAEPNDRSFLFGLEVDGGRVRELLLYPTLIEDCQARRAPRAAAEASIGVMQELCAELRTTAVWQDRAQVLVIEP
jgi:poly-gamma-glutamate synthesis protein (capsule biosynthesis protein)